MTALDAPKFVREELGLTQLEIIINHLDERTAAYAERVRAAADKAGVKFMNLQLGGQMSASDPAVRAKSIAEIKDGMRIAAALGAPSVRADVGGKAGEPLDLAITSASYKELADFGATIGVMPMPENHGGHSSDPDTLVSIMRALDPRVRAIVDWGNLRVENQTQRIEGTRKLLPYTGLVSAKVDRFDADYRPGYDVSELVRLVESSGYRGKYSIEITNPPADIVRGAITARDIIAKSLASWSKTTRRDECYEERKTHPDALFLTSSATRTRCSRAACRPRRPPSRPGRHLTAARRRRCTACPSPRR